MSEPIEQLEKITCKHCLFFEEVNLYCFKKRRNRGRKMKICGHFMEADRNTDMYIPYQNIPKGCHFIPLNKAAQMLAFNPRYLRQYRTKAGMPPFIEVGNGPNKRIWYDLYDLYQWLTSHEKIIPGGAPGSIDI